MITALAILIGLSQSQPITPQYQSELDQQSIAFMDEYFQHLSNRDVLDQFQHDYAKYVNYFSKEEEVLRDKAAFIKRWPERNYRPRQNSIHVTCEMLYGEPVCAVNGLVDFKCRSPQRHAVSTGTAYFYAYIWFGENYPEIIGEDSGVVR